MEQSGRQPYEAAGRGPGSSEVANRVRRSWGLAGRFAALLLLCLAAFDAAALKLEVQVNGLEGEQEANVLALLAIYQERDDETMSVPRLLALYRQAPAQIREALAPFGLYQVSVTDNLSEPSSQDGTWVATYDVDPGPPVKIASVDYQITGPGADNPAFSKVFPMKVGDVLVHSVYEQAKADLQYAATSEGYLSFRLVRHEVLIDPVAYNARIFVHLETGPRFFLGDVRFDQDLLDDDLMRRYLNFKPGDVYDPDLLVGLQARLLATEYFSDVEVIPQKDPAGASTTVPIEVKAERSKANSYRFGVGYATNFGPRVSADWKRRWLNRWGHKFRTQLSLSPAVSSWYLDYRIPILDPMRDYVSIKPDVGYYDTDTRQGWMATLQVARSVVTPEDWRRTIGIDYRYEDYTLNGEASTQTQVNELVPYVTWSKTRADDPIYTRHGHRIKYGIYGSSTALFSPTNYLSGTIDFKMIRSFWSDYRLIFRTELGATLADSVDDLPASRRFYTGGDNSIRGWGFDTLGPNDPVTDETVGGRYLAVGSIELEREIYGPWSAAVFTDFGNAFDPEYEQKFEQSVGLGLRWRSPIGQVRVDVAFALTKQDQETSYGLPPARLHLVIGPDL